MLLKTSALLMLVGIAIAANLDVYKPLFSLPKGVSRFSRLKRNAVDEKVEAVKCTREGMMCDGCNKLVYCLDTGDAELSKHEFGVCEEGLTCHAETAECTDTPNPTCDLAIKNYKFVCKQTGVFPHPYDCFTYYFCSPQLVTDKVVLTETKMSCLNKNFSYDPLTTLCRNKLVNGSCEPFVNKCTKLGESSAIKGNEQLYSKCFMSPTPEADTDPPKMIVPYMFACNGNFVYNGTKCVDPESKLPPPPPATVDANNNCLATGYYPDPISCKNYLNCVYVARPPARGACPAGNRYNHATKTCIPFVC